MYLRDLIETDKIKNIEISDKTEVTGIDFDYKNIKSGYLYVCLKSDPNEVDMLSAKAKELGAVAVVSEREIVSELPYVVVNDTRDALAKLCARFYDNPDRKIKMIGVTGTNGKTSTVNYIADMLGRERCGVIGTLGYFSGKMRIGEGMTTPDPPELYRLIDRFVKDGMEYCIMEVSAHAIYYRKVEYLRFDIGIFTNCTRDHLDFFGDFDRYQEQKIAFMTRHDIPVKIVNTDDDTGKSISCSTPCNTVGQNETAQYRIADIVSVNGLQFCLKNDGRDMKMHTSLFGRFNAYNIAEGILALCALGYSMENAQGRTNLLHPIEGRFNVYECDGRKYVIDFAHTPDGMEKVLKTAREMCHDAIIAVFGCGGNRDRGKRPLMGATAEKYADIVILTSDNPREENAADIVSDIKSGMQLSKPTIEIFDRKQAIEYADKISRKGDVILIMGKGSENYMEINGIKYPYSDKLVIEEIIDKRKRADI